MTHILLEIFSCNKRLLIAAGILLLINGALSLFINNIQSPSLLAAQTRWNKLRQQAALMGKMDVNSIYKKSITDLGIIRTKIPLRRQFPKVLADIFEKASFHKVSVGKTTYKALVSKEQNLLPHEISLTVNGNYIQIKSFLTELLETDEMLVVDSLSLVNKDIYEEKITMDLRLTAYLREGA